MGKIYLDTETCGFCGPAVLIQWSEDEGKTIHMHDVWKEPIVETLKLIEKIATNEEGIVGFNLSFDWFQLCKLYTMFCLYPDPTAYPEDIIEDLAILEEKARDGPCLRPVKACDLMLVARKGPYQSTMNRDPIRIRRVPTALAWKLAAELEQRVIIPDIYFARKSNKFDPHFKVYDIKDKDDEIIPDFKDIVLSFAPSSALKALVADALKVKPDAILLFADVEINKAFLPVEHQYAPFCTAIGRPGNWKGTWPSVINYHIDHWAFNDLARSYAAKDVEYLPQLYEFFQTPKLGDDDSELACMVGAVRWRGFAVDIEGIKELKEKALQKKDKYPTAPAKSRIYVAELMDPIERVAMGGSTKKVVLEEISKWTVDCPECGTEGILPNLDTIDDEIWEGEEEFDPETSTSVAVMTDCSICAGKGNIPHPAAERAKQVISARMAAKEVELYDKLIMAGRLHADLNIIGARSSRMSGSGNLNVQGINRGKFVRSKFPLAFPSDILSGGDFSGFEVVLADAAYNDENLRNDLLSGKKIHALFGVFLYPGHSYEEIVASAGMPNDMYTPSKSGVFALIYGGDYNTLHTRLGIPVEVAQQAYERFCQRYPGVARAREKIINGFMTMKQRRQYGPIEWSDPVDYIESMFGFRRYFTLEHMIEKALFELANKPPKSWHTEFKDLRIYRKDREQSAVGALQSALYGAAFGLQASNMRAGANHLIQSSGAQITKAVQRAIWGIQPSGVNDWKVCPLNIHDEIMVPTNPDYVDQVEQVVYNVVESYRSQVPLIAMEWNRTMKNWASK